MIDPKASKTRVHVDLYAFVLVTMAIGWLVFTASSAWKLDLYVQTFLLLVIALVWTILGHLVMNEIRKARVAEAQRRMSREGER